ncbi:putative lipoprotein [Hyphomonas polymorpha PS728]|uniref:Putative lipoprotein n=1 Tax=Hyphomonas polymorpha PS728 TaxID=1280954 RepID=A0A062VD52_9PROT|nr:MULTISPECIES: hypothetical protein [Hyphomonas]AXE63502.1 hypothetical protein BBF93_04170 [Hyphomonas sp. CACIAM 19H1]KCZ98233.1 putative lipoprotein [Hyphomonas polymorpha PS728]
MKTIMFVTAVGILSGVAGCASGAPSNAYANPLDACASIQDDEDRARCMQNMVADVALTTKREKDRKKGP